MTQMMLLAQTSHSGLTTQTVNLLYLQSTGWQRIWVGYNKRRHLTSIKDPSSLSVLTKRQGRQVPFTSQLKRLDKSYNRHWHIQCKRIWWHMYSAKNKATRTRFKG
jgi:hypothetical protein